MLKQLALILLVTFAAFVSFAKEIGAPPAVIALASGRSAPTQACDELAKCEALLLQTSRNEEGKFKNACCTSNAPTRGIAIIGNGIAATAAALNLHDPVRVYGSKSFWTTLVGLPEIWQTTLKVPFDDANLMDPWPNPHDPRQRIPREAVLIANLEGLVRAKADYLETGPVTVTARNDAWIIVDADGRAEIVKDTLIVATGVLRPLRITDIMLGERVDRMRRNLADDKRIMTGDDCVRSVEAPFDEDKNVIGVIGAGGNSVDCIIRLLKTSTPPSKRRIVIWGKPDAPLLTAPAYEDFITKYGPNLCRLPNTFITKIEYDKSIITVNDQKTWCVEDLKIDALVESLGRYTGDPPPAVVSAAKGRAITYIPIADKSGALIAIQVKFDDQEVPKMYLIGAAASWIPQGVVMTSKKWDKFQGALREMLEKVNKPADPVKENPPPGFAAAAFMGTNLARCIKKEIACPPLDP